MESKKKFHKPGSKKKLDFFKQSYEWIGMEFPEINKEQRYRHRGGKVPLIHHKNKYGNFRW